MFCLSENVLMVLLWLVLQLIKLKISGHVFIMEILCLRVDLAFKTLAFLICFPAGSALSLKAQRNDSIMQLIWTKPWDREAHYLNWRSNLWSECKQNNSRTTSERQLNLNDSNTDTWLFAAVMLIREENHNLYFFIHHNSDLLISHIEVKLYLCE